MYTIKTASFANAENTAVILDTEEVGHVAISEVDTPAAWLDFNDWRDKGNSVRAYGEGSAFKAEKERAAMLAAKKVEAWRKLAALGITEDDVKAIMG